MRHTARFARGVFQSAHGQPWSALAQRGILVLIKYVIPTE